MATRKKKAVQEEAMEQEFDFEMEEFEAEEGGAELLEVDEELLRDADGKELLFPGGPTLDQVEDWKSQFGDELYLTEFENEVLIWRTLKRKEYKEIMKIQGADQFYKEERICERCVMWPSNFSFMAMAQSKAGIPTLVAELVMEKSGFQAKTGAMRL